MKIFRALVLALVGFFLVQSSFAQDSLAQVADTAVHKTKHSKKSSKHKVVSADSTAQTIPVVKDTTLPLLPDAVVKDTTAHVHKPLKKPGRTKHIFSDSVQLAAYLGDDSADRYLGLPLNAYIHSIPIKRSKQKVVATDTLTDADTLKYRLLLQYMNESEIAVLERSLEIRDSMRLVRDSLYTDSVARHWEGWKKYQVQTDHSYTLYSKGVLKGKSKSELQYNIADFYLYLNGQMVKPPKSTYFFFAAGCLCFKYDDTLLLNSGLGFKVGVGVGIKIVDGRFTSTLHANTHNQEVYKLSKDDSVYLKSVMATPITQSLKLKSEPAYASNEIIIGEYRASYKKFYQKNENDEDELRQYSVRIVFRCRVTGGIDSIKSLSGPTSK